MRAFIEKSNRFLDIPLDVLPRVLLLSAVVMLIPVFVTPLYEMTMFAPQYPEGLRLHIYSYKLEGGNAGQDLKEINVLNHYIGMRDLDAADFTEFKWIPFVVGVMGLLFLRTAVMGRMSHLVDVLVLYVYFGVYALWSFGYKMWVYGHTLAPTAAVKIDAFTPPLFGYKKLANFEVYSYPGPGSYGLTGAAVVLILAVYLAWRQSRQAAVKAV